jgi:hypothetical protein
VAVFDLLSIFALGVAAACSAAATLVILRPQAIDQPRHLLPFERIAALGLLALSLSQLFAMGRCLTAPMVRQGVTSWILVLDTSILPTVISLLSCAASIMLLAAVLLRRWSDAQRDIQSGRP